MKRELHLFDCQYWWAFIEMSLALGTGTLFIYYPFYETPHPLKSRAFNYAWFIGEEIESQGN